MNNEPVAWMDDFGNVFEMKNQFFHIPLYTHPAKPIDKPDECIDGCPKNQTCDYCAGIKTLTDDEIEQEWVKSCPDKFHTNLIGFARAILKKASEK